jgi:hypothetical protein
MGVLREHNTMQVLVHWWKNALRNGNTGEWVNRQVGGTGEL